MACLSCAERARLLRMGTKNLVNGRPVAPVVRQFGQTIVNDFNKVRSTLRPANPRLGSPRGR